MSGKRKALCAVLTLLTAALLLWIFSNSLKNSQESASQSGAVREWIQTILDALFSGSVVISSHAVRKLAHFSEYALLGAMLLFTWRAYTAERKRLLFPALVAALAPFLDEGLQFFSEGRAPMLSDVGIDLLGCAAGFLFAWVVLALASACRKHKRDKRERGGSDV